MSSFTNSSSASYRRGKETSRGNNNNNSSSSGNQQKWKRQSEMTVEEVQERLKGFNEFNPANDDLDVLEPGMQVRYISYDRKLKRKTLKMGGVLKYVDPQGRFLRVQSMINSGIPPFSVQLKSAAVYYKHMLKKDPRFDEMLDMAGGSRDRLIRIVGLFKDMDLDKIDNCLNYCSKHAKGKVSTLISQHQKLRRSVTTQQQGGGGSAARSTTVQEFRTVRSTQQ